MRFNNIVSANYRDRSHPDRWLLRGFNEKPESSTAYRAVTATGIVFCPSTAYESGFGCSVVGWCTSAVGHTEDPKIPENAFRVKFDPRGFFYRETDEAQVPHCDKLILLSDGSMYAVVATQEAAVAA